jgi:LacI family transcriptional regulator
MATINDVAKKAGVSKTLVSRVINRQSGVSAASAEKIMQAMKELNYTPNAIARSLVLQKTRILGVILDNLCEPFFFDFIKGIEDEITASGYDVMFCSARNDSNVKSRYIDFFSQGRADGFILYGSNLSDLSLIERLKNSTFPFVIVENDVDGTNMNNVCVDNVYGSKIAINHLFEKGCRKIYHVTGDMTVKAALRRQEGYIAGMQEHKIKTTDDMILTADFTVKTGYQVMAAFINRVGKENLPDAFYFGADATALGGMMALEDAGVRIPEDVQIVGFDNDKLTVPERRLKKLTTIAQPLYDMGVSAVNLLTGDIQEHYEEKMKVIYYPEIIIRETTK